MAQDVHRRLPVLAALLAAILCITVPGQALAWGALGHRLVCAVALMQLDDDERAEVDRLATRFRGPGGHRYRYFTTGCTFADEARGRARDGAAGWRRFAPFERWHFVNVPRAATTVRQRHCGGDCVLTGIKRHFRTFANHDLDERVRAEAMLLMSHWIADAHQPMHVAFANDFGGNAVDVTSGFYDQDNLHAVWDTGVVEEMVDAGNWWAFAEMLSASVTPAERMRWSSSPPIDWVSESLDITVDSRTRYCRRTGGGCRATRGARRLGARYQEYAAPIVRRRIVRAGVRLAAYLARGLQR